MMQNPELNRFETLVLADLSVVKHQMESLIGGLQPGRVSRLEERVEQHEIYLQRMKGLAGALGVFVTLINVAFDLWRGSH